LGENRVGQGGERPQRDQKILEIKKIGLWLVRLVGVGHGQKP